LKLFPAKGPLESVAMDILGPLPKSKHGNRFLLVITDRYSKVTQTVPLRAITALSVARAFCEQWVYVYGAPVTLLTDNGPQFTAKCFEAVCAELGVIRSLRRHTTPILTGKSKGIPGRFWLPFGDMSPGGRTIGTSSLRISPMPKTAGLIPALECPRSNSPSPALLRRNHSRPNQGKRK
jgi:Integrase core domain